MRKTVKVANIDCAQCAVTIENHFNKLDDIEAKVHVTSRQVIFDYDKTKYTQEDLYKNLADIGYKPITSENDQKRAKLIDKIDLIIAIVFSIPLLWTMFVHLGLHFIYVPEFFMYGYFQWILSSFVLFISGRRFFINTFYQLKAKNFGMDSLVVIGTSTAYIYIVFMKH